VQPADNDELLGLLGNAFVNNKVTQLDSRRKIVDPRLGKNEIVFTEMPGVYRSS
jgi:hypothetical protein